MISLAKVLSGNPVPIINGINFYQPTIQEIVDMGEGVYWSTLSLWLLKRKDLINQENETTQGLDDFNIWLLYILGTPPIREALKKSCEVLLREKVEFFDISGTIYIGEKESGVILDETFYLLMREVCQRVMPVDNSEKDKQFRETENMSERERRMIEKMRLSEKKIEETKNPDRRPEDFLGNRILGLVAVGGYTFEQVYNMTMLQFNMLLQKYVDIQTFELKTQLSPYISSEDSQNGSKFWLD